MIAPRQVSEPQAANLRLDFFPRHSQAQAPRAGRVRLADPAPAPSRRRRRSVNPVGCDGDACR